jgi:hypothetical protein
MPRVTKSQVVEKRLSGRCSRGIDSGLAVRKGTFVVELLSPSGGCQLRRVKERVGLDNRKVPAMACGAAVIAGAMVIGMIRQCGPGLNRKKAGHNEEHQGSANSTPRSSAHAPGRISHCF